MDKGEIGIFFSITSIILIIVLLIGNFILNEKKYNNQNDLFFEFTNDEISLKENDSFNLQNNFLTNYETENIEWNSSNEDVVTIDKDGVITALDCGTVIITANINGEEKNFTVNVSNEEIYIESIMLSTNRVIMQVDGTFKINYTYSPSNANIHNFIYKSSDNDIATVDNYGNISAKKEGTAIIVVTYEGNNNVKEQLEVIVKETQENIVIEDIILSENKKELYVGNYFDLNVKTIPSSVNDSLIYESSNSNVATVDENGRVKAISQGEAVIVVSTPSSIKKSISLIVKNNVILVKDIILKNDNITIKKGNTYKIEASVLPSSANNNLKYESSNSNVATVDDNGVITALEIGKTIIKVSAVNGISKNINLVIEENKIIVEDLILSEKEKTILPGAYFYINAEVKPNNADSNLTYESSNKNIVTVSSNGKVVGVLPGTAIITVKTVNGIKKSINIIVKDDKINLQSVTILEKTISLKIGEKITLNTSIKPANANNYQLLWKTSNSKIASVVNGVVTANSSGNTYIEVYDKITGVNSQITINVKESLPDTIMLQDFDNFSNFYDLFSKTNLSNHGVIYPEVLKVNTEIESVNGAYFDFRKAKSNGWAQIYNYSKNIPTNFSEIDEKYNLRFWISNGDYNDLYITLLLNDGKNSNYIDATMVKLVKYNGDIINSGTTNKGGYGNNSSITIPNGFKGWISFPLKNIKSIGNNLININNVKYISLDIRPNNPKANTYYVLDNICLSTKLKANQSNIRNEIKNKIDLVGMFYTIWFDFWEASNNLYNNDASDNYATGNIYNVSENKFGPINSFHYWAKPALGYYTSNNTEVIKKHMEMLVNAGIDFIYIDFTNLMDKNVFVNNSYNNDSSTSKDAYANYYEFAIWDYQVTKPFNNLLKTLKAMINNGQKVPKIVPWISNYDNSQYAINRIYNEYFKDGKYSDLWLYYNNKPLLMSIKTPSVSDNRFTYRATWALFEQNDIYNNTWTWRQKDNSVYGKGPNGELEEMSVNTAVSWYYMSVPTGVKPRNHGITFYEQWRNVYQHHPKITLVGTWNEWGAQRLVDYNAECKDYCFTDQYTQEYSNDIEPMSGGHNDQYYKWLIEYVDSYRKYEVCPRLVEEGY